MTTVRTCTAYFDCVNQGREPFNFEECQMSKFKNNPKFHFVKY